MIARSTSPMMRTPGAPRSNNFPLIAGRLIGRDAAARHVRDLISAYRVVTLTGPGRIGKTPLAIEAARGMFDGFDDGGWFVELASLSDPGHVPSTVASALGLQLSGEISAESVARAAAAKHLLLVLDNCEHVIDAAANLAESFTRFCRHITIVATSREVLRIGGEAVYRVPPLDVPALGQENPDHVMDCSAVELFIARTMAMDTDRTPRAEELTSVAAICRRLDGIPLAIEFAAASSATLGIASVATGLRDRFALLTRGRRTALARQRTLREALDWGHDLLPDAERRLLRRLAVFQGGFTLDAAGAVVTDTGLDATMVMSGVANLVAKSLVALDTTQGDSRWRLLETIRIYAFEKLAGHSEIDTVSGRHAADFRDLFTLPPPGTSFRLSNDDITDRVREIDNVRAALDWSFSLPGDMAIGVHLTVAYTPVWLHLSLIGECRDRCEQAVLASDGNPGLNARLQMELQIALGNTLIVTLGPGDQTGKILTRTFEIARALNEPDAQVRVLAALSTVASIMETTARHRPRSKISGRSLMKSATLASLLPPISVSGPDC